MTQADRLDSDSRFPTASAAARFHSLLFDDDSVDVDGSHEPAFFADLNLDQVVESVTAGREEYDLAPFFHVPLHSVAAVEYRHDVLRDLEKDGLRRAVQAFAREMRRTREHLAQSARLHHPYQKERWFLDAVEIYCEAVRSLADGLTDLETSSSGFQGFRDYLRQYTSSDRFTSLAAATCALQEALAGVRYALHIRARRVRVSRYGGEADYSAEVEATFAKFQQGAVNDYRAKLPDWAEMNHVEARILELVARLHPEVFGALDEYCTRHGDYFDRTVAAFDRSCEGPPTGSPTPGRSQRSTASPTGR